MRLRSIAAAGAAWLLVACGGGGDGGGIGSPAPGNGGPPPPSTPSTPSTPSSSDVSILVTSPARPVASGSVARFQVIVANAGPDVARNVAASVTTTGGITVISVTCVATGGATCPASASSLAVDTLPTNGSLLFEATAAVPVEARGHFSGSVTVRADNDVTAANNEAAWGLDAFSADLVVGGDAPNAEVNSGGVAAYAMTVSNSGPDDASDVVIENIVGPRQTLGSIVCRAAGGATCPTTLGPTMSVPSLPVGGSLAFDVSTQVAEEALGYLSNTLYVAPQGDPVASNNVATAAVATAIPAGTTTFIKLQSDQGDFVGAGGDYLYTPANAVLTVTASGGHLSVGVDGDTWWNADFQLPAGIAQLQPGTYTNLRRFPFHEAAVGGLSWGGDGRGCNTLIGSITVNSVSYVNGDLAAIDLRFEQHCEGAAAALRGQIRWQANDATRPPGPVVPPPATLWSPPAGATPASGNYVYLQSDAGDFIGAGATRLYTQANAVMSLNNSGVDAVVSVNGDATWSGHFRAMNSVTRLEPGYYPSLRRWPFNNPTRGGLDWSGDGRGCNTLSGWFVVDSVTYVGTTMSSLDLRFEQHCEGGTPALRGKIHWVNGDTTQPAGPQALPAGLWSPAPGTTPASGNYVYLQSSSGDWIGQGQTYLHTPNNSTLAVVGSGLRATVTVNGIGGWTGDFVGMNSISTLQPGYYPGLRRWPFHNPTMGGLSWSGYGNGCNTLTGWFAIDSISHVNGNLASIDLRFEQRCDGGPPLRGKIHWIN